MNAPEPPRAPLADSREAWAPYAPGAGRPWGLREAAHLYRRAAFGATWSELTRAVREGPAATVARLMQPDGDPAGCDRTYDAYDAAAADAASSAGLRAWWLHRMIRTPHPLREKMTLLWHGFFGVGTRRVKLPRLMARHVHLLRTHALGRFDALLGAALADPAVLVNLDAAAHRRMRPCEFFAREVLRKYTFGEGPYTPDDVRALARSYTGTVVVGGAVKFRESEHDGTAKTLLGQTGPWRPDDAVRLLLSQGACARHVVRTVYRWFVSETTEPDDAYLAPLVRHFADTFDIGALVETVLRANAFFSPAAYRARVKSPVELALGIVRAFEGLASTSRLGADCAALGQDLYDPPTACGWLGGRAWINGFTMRGRVNLAASLLGAAPAYEGTLDPSAVWAAHGQDAAVPIAAFLLDLLLQGDVPAGESARIEALAARWSQEGDRAAAARAVARTVLAMPEYQLA